MNRVTDDSAHARISGDKPPVLKLHVLQRLRMLALINLGPILLSLWLWWQFSQGNAHWKTPDNHRVLWACAIILLACAVIGISCWMALPLARWLRDYPAWHMRHVSRLGWLLPAIGGWICFSAIYLVSALATLGAGIVIITGLWHLIAPGH